MRLLTGLILAVLAQDVVTAESVRFGDGPVGSLPPGWSVSMTHAGGQPQWRIVRDPSAPSPPFVFAQTSEDRTAGRFPLAVWNGASIRNGEVSVAFKTISGIVDQAAGIVWRYRDANNYYIVRANALENNVVLYKVKNGVRASLAPKGLPSRSYGVKHPIPSRKWMKLAVAFKDDLFTVSLNGEKLFDVEDTTFANAGKTGLWTKADSVTYFDNFEVAGK